MILDKKKLPTNTTTQYHAVHRWFNFIAGFSPEFVWNCCEKANLNNDSQVLDPFAGCGTTLVESCKHGLRSFGYEPNPFFFRISQGKLPCKSCLESLEKIEYILLKGFQNPQDISILPDAPSKFLTKLFDQKTLSSLLGAREILLKSDLQKSDLAFLILSKVLDLCSHSQTDGIYKAPTSKKQSKTPKFALKFILEILRKDLFVFRENNFNSLASVFENSSENMSEIERDTISLIVTSPPYLNNFDYAEMTRMYLYFWGIANSWSEITNQVRSKLIVNTTTALKGHKDKQDIYRQKIPSILYSELDDIVYKLQEQRKIRAGKKEYNLLVYPYFCQMTQVLKECYRVLKKDAYINIMIADSALYGIHISTPQYLEFILQNLGFRETKCQFIRKRGHRWLLEKRDGSLMGLGEYHLQALK
ncbi:MAG: DNA methylase [Lyngbya sp.]|nr:DNA methylase [Lyngbya sp.]